MTALDSVFGTMRALAWWQECLRALVVFAYGLALLRCTGRRTFGRWSTLDILVSIVFGSSLSRALTGNAPFGGTIAAMSVLLLLHWVLARWAARWGAASWLLEGRPIHLARDGERDAGAMLRQSVSEADLAEALRGVGIEHVRHARQVVLEPSGRITVVKQG